MSNTVILKSGLPIPSPHQNNTILAVWEGGMWVWVWVLVGSDGVAKEFRLTLAELARVPAWHDHVTVKAVTA